MWRRLRAAWKAFRNPAVLEPAPTPAPSAQIAAPLIGASGLPLPEVAPHARYGRFRVVRHHAGTDTFLFPILPGDDGAARARRVFEEYVPRYVGEYAIFYDGETERGRKACPAL